jgi:hypothetical protein
VRRKRIGVGDYRFRIRQVRHMRDLAIAVLFLATGPASAGRRPAGHPRPQRIRSKQQAKTSPCSRPPSGIGPANALLAASAACSTASNWAAGSVGTLCRYVDVKVSAARCVAVRNSSSASSARASARPRASGRTEVSRRPVKATQEVMSLHPCTLPGVKAGGVPICRLVEAKFSKMSANFAP